MSVLKSGMLALLATAAYATSAIAGSPIGVTPADSSAEFGGQRSLSLGGPVVNVATSVYDNTTSPANAGISSTNLQATWGDEVHTTGTGLLQSMKFTVYNSSTQNTGDFAGGTVQIQFQRLSDNSSIGSFSVNLDNTASPLPPGFYQTWTISGLSGANINLDTPDLLVTQKLTSLTPVDPLVGTDTTRMGVVSLTPPTVGSSPGYYYRDDGTNPAGFYVLGTGGVPPADVGYQLTVDVVPEPATIGLVSLSLLGFGLVRRRRS